MGGIQYVYWPGTTTRLTPWMLNRLQKLDADLRRLFGVHLVLNSSHTQRGIRTYQEQVDLFLSRYRVQWGLNKGPYGDVRWWNGKRYVRHSGLGTVAQPGTSNHEIQNNYYGAIDLADSGGPGIGTEGSQRSNWLRENAATYGLQPEGFKFDEAWHYRVPNIFQAVPSGGITPPKPTPIPEPEPIEEDDDMASHDRGVLYLAPEAEKDRKKQRQYLLLHNTDSGWETEISSSLGNSISDEVRRDLQAVYEIPTIREVTETIAKAIKDGLRKIRPIN